MGLDINSLGDHLRKERSSPSLQELGEGFYKDLKSLLEDADEKYPPYSRERENLENLVSDLFNTREKKLLLFALSFARSGEKPDIENMTSEEEEFVVKLTDMLRKRREKLLSTGGNAKPQRKKKKEESIQPEIEKESEQKKEHSGGKKQATKMITLRILEDLPPIVGEDGKTYGAFKTEDVVALPERNAKLFIKQGYGEAIDIQPE